MRRTRFPLITQVASFDEIGNGSCCNRDMKNEEEVEDNEHSRLLIDLALHLEENESAETLWARIRQVLSQRRRKMRLVLKLIPESERVILDSPTPQEMRRVIFYKVLPKKLRNETSL